MGSEFEDELFQRLDRVRPHRHPDRCGILHLAQHREAVRAAAPAGGGAERDRRAGRAPDRLRRGPGDDPGDRRRPMRRRSPFWRMWTRRPQFNATGVKPIVHRNYAGRRHRPARRPARWCSRRPHLPYLATKVGDDIVTASGTTLLGADDKAGVAIVMAAARHLLRHPDIPHGPIRICFTPDEEIGRGVHADLPGDLQRRRRLHAGRRRAGRDRLRDLLGRQGGGAGPGRLDPSRLGQGQAGQRAAPGRQDRRHAAAGHADARDHRRPPGLHPPLPDERHRGRGRAALHPARLRARRPARPRRAARSRSAPRSQATEPRAQITLHDHPAVPQHALLAGERHAPGRAGARGLPRSSASSPSPRPSAAAPTARA